MKRPDDTARKYEGYEGYDDYVPDRLPSGWWMLPASAVVAGILAIVVINWFLT